MSDFLRIRNWKKWQSYRSDRGQPPWIKIHRQIMRDPNWVALTDAERGQLVSLWILAADRDGEIPSDPQLLQKLCYLNEPPALESLIRQGFIDATTTPPRRQTNVKVTPLARSREAEAETDTEKKKKLLATGWSQRAADLWQDVMGGTPPGGRIGKALKPLVAKHGESEVLEEWGKYLRSKEPDFANPQDFASKYGVHRNGKHAPKDPPVEQRTGIWATDEDFKPGGIFHDPSS